MKGFVKIGKTEREPKEMAKELSSTTGVQTPFVVAHESYFESCSEAEDFVHKHLCEKGYRVSKKVEFFEIPTKVVIGALIEASNYFGEFSKEDSCNSFFDDLDQKPYVAPWCEMLDKADSYYYGSDIETQDYEEAMTCYIEAIKLGSADAYSLVGDMYIGGEGVSQSDETGFQYYKEGAKKGSGRCYGKLAEIFTSEGDLASAKNCWAKFFGQGDSPLDSNLAYLYIITFIYINGFKLKYVDKLKNIVGDLICISESLIDLQKDILEHQVDAAEIESTERLLAHYEDCLQFILDRLNLDTKPDIEPWAEMFEVAEDYYYGQDGEIQDFKEAMTYFMKAIKLGSLEAYVYVGDMYSSGEGVGQDDKAAFQFFKEGAKNGNVKCYGKMASLLNSTGEFESARKCWARFFEQDSSSIDTMLALYYVILFIDMNGFKLEHVDKLMSIVDDLILIMKTLIASAEDAIESSTDEEEREEAEGVLERHEDSLKFILDNLT